MVTLAYYLGRLLLILTVFTAISEALRRRERQRQDIALFMSVLLLSGFIPNRVPGALGLRLFLFCLLPVLALRLVGHFRRISTVAFALGGLVAAGFGTAGILTAGPI